MITPQFEVKQDDDFLYVEIRAPYVKASLVQFEVANEVFVFSLPPYYLRLRLPGALIEDERMTSRYDVASSIVFCRVAKLHPGTHFPDLDMLSKLLATKQQQQGSTVPKPLIQEVPSSSGPIAVPDDDFDWEIEQNIPTEPSSSVSYGFNNQYSERIGLSVLAGNEINELTDPERETTAERYESLRAAAAEQFDAEHYLADLYDDGMIAELLRFSIPTDLELDSSMKDRIVKLGYREFLLSDPKSIYIGIIPLVFGWAYDFRTNLGDITVESSWNVGKLTPSMSHLFSSYTSVSQVVRDCTARALTKPLYRHWGLTLQVWKDVVQVLKGGRKNVLVVFGKLLEIFESELHFCYRQILIEDYTIWIQHASEKVLIGLTSELVKSLATLDKASIGLPLEAAENGTLFTDREDEKDIVTDRTAEIPDSDDESDDS